MEEVLALDEFGLFAGGSQSQGEYFFEGIEQVVGVLELKV